MNGFEFNLKAKSAGIHLCLSGLIGILAAAVVLGLWYPGVYRGISGGWVLFAMVIGVDACVGPLLTFVVYNPQKPRKELFRDLGFIVVLQVAALIYGIYVIIQARPVFLVYELDRFRVVTFVEIDKTDLPKAKEQFQSISFTGPKVIAARRPLSTDSDYIRTMELALQGIEISHRPEYWISYDEKRDEVLKRAKTIDALVKKAPDKLEVINTAVGKTGFKEGGLKYLPLQGRNTSDWIVLLNASNADVVGFAPVDGFID